MCAIRRRCVVMFCGALASSIAAGRDGGVALAADDRGGGGVVVRWEDRLTLTPPAPDRSFGHEVGAAGDVNGDGWPDVAVAAPGWGEGTSRVGRVFVFSGADGSLLREVRGRVGERFGVRLEGAEDVDGDGAADLRVAAVARDAEARFVERLHAISGRTGERLYVKDVLVWDPRAEGLLEEDLSRDGVVDAADVALAVEGLARGGMRVDLDGDGVWTSVDVGRVLEAVGRVGGEVGEAATGRGGWALDDALFDCWINPQGAGCDWDTPPNDGPGGFGIPGDGDDRLVTCVCGIGGQLWVLRGQSGALLGGATLIEGGVFEWTLLTGEKLLDAATPVGPRLDYVAGLVAGEVDVRLAFHSPRCFAPAFATDTLEIDDLFLEIEGCAAIEGFDEQVRLETSYFPGGGGLSWNQASGPPVFEWDEDNERLEFMTGFEPGVVRLVARYALDGMVRVRVCEIQVTGRPDRDHDGDGLSDADEVAFGTHANDPDTDDDGFGDHCEWNWDSDGANANSPNFDVAPWNADGDHDGLPDMFEDCNGLDPTHFDSDGDGLADGFEMDHGLDPHDPDSDGDGVPDFDEDQDNDGLTNGREQSHGTDPFDSDSDNDGVNDGTEVDQGSFPNGPSDGGQPPSDDQAAEVIFTVGDPSGSQSERWGLVVGSRRLIAPLGAVVSERYAMQRGESHPVRVVHMGSSLSPPDYDYVATIGGAGVLVDDPEGLLGGFSDGCGRGLSRLVERGGDPRDECNLAEGKEATLWIVLVDLRIDSDHDGEITDDDRESEDGAVGRLLIVNDDDDNRNGIPDHDDVAGEDDDLVPADIRVLGVPTDSTPLTWALGYPERIKVFTDAQRKDHIPSGQSFPWPPATRLYVEAVDASVMTGDSPIAVQVRRADAPLWHDVARATSLHLLVAGVGDLSVDEEHYWGSAHLKSGLGVDTHDTLDELDVVIRGFRNDAPLGSQARPMRSAAAAASFALDSSPISGYSVEVDFLGARRGSNSGASYAGVAHAITLRCAATELVADGHSEIEVEAFVVDQFGNPVPDGREITWELLDGVASFIGNLRGAHGKLHQGCSIARFRAPQVSNTSQPLRVRATVDGVSHELALDVSQTEAELSYLPGPLSIGRGSAGDTRTLTLHTDAAAGTPVFWSISNGEIRSAEGVVDNDGTCALIVSANDSGSGRTFAGRCFVTATVGDRLAWSELWFEDNSGYWLEAPVIALAGDEITNGEHAFAIYGATPPGENPPAFQPQVVHEPYFAEAPITIHGTPGSRHRVELHGTGAAFATLIGVPLDGAMTLDAHGKATFRVQSAGIYEGVDPLPVLARVTELDPIKGLRGTAETRVVTLHLVDKSWYCPLVNGAKGFIGLDTEGVAGMAGSFAGGMLIVGDVGVLLKNSWRAAGYSDKEPDLVESTLAGLGLATELAVGAGEPLDAVISGSRAVITGLGKCALSDVLATLLKRSITDGGDLTFFRRLPDLLSNDVQLAFLKQALTSEELAMGFIRIADELGDAAPRFVTQLTTISQSISLGGIKGSQGVVATLSDPSISPEVFAALRSMPSHELDSVLSFIARNTSHSVHAINPASIGKSLARATALQLNPSVCARLLGALVGVKGLQKALNGINGSPVANSIRGRWYELQCAVRMEELPEWQGATIEFLERAVSNSAGRTDIDIVLRNGDQWTYVQAKSGDVGSPDAAREWIAKVRQHAMDQNIPETNLQIVYVTPNPANVADDVRAAIESSGARLLEVGIPLPQ